jgi:hypothetical protein
MPRPLPHNTQHSQETDIHTPGGIRNRNLSKDATADPRLRPRGHRDRPIQTYKMENSVAMMTRTAGTLGAGVESCSILCASRGLAVSHCPVVLSITNAAYNVIMNRLSLGVHKSRASDRCGEQILRRRLNSTDLRYKTCFMSLFWRQEL